jgi:hypothetical protein
MSLTKTLMLEERKMRLTVTGELKPFTRVSGTSTVSEVRAYFPGLIRSFARCSATPTIALAANFSESSPLIDGERRIANRARKSASSGAVTTLESFEIACRLTV